MKIIVVLRNSGHLEDRSWRCNNEWETKKLVKWLNDNQIVADALTDEEWEILHKGPIN